MMFSTREGGEQERTLRTGKKKKNPVAHPHVEFWVRESAGKALPQTSAIQFPPEVQGMAHGATTRESNSATQRTRTKQKKRVLFVLLSSSDAIVTWICSLS
jgi:hypothetical protein